MSPFGKPGVLFLLEPHAAASLLSVLLDGVARNLLDHHTGIGRFALSLRPPRSKIDPSRRPIQYVVHVLRCSNSRRELGGPLSISRLSDTVVGAASNPGCFDTETAGVFKNKSRL